MGTDELLAAGGRPADAGGRVADGGGGPLSWLSALERERRAAGLRRAVVPRRPGGVGEPLDLAGNDYLGLTRHPAVIEGGVAALRTWGAGSTGSRLVTGSTTLHAELEDALASHTGFDSALVFATGYAANLAVVTALTGPGDLVVADEYNHASLIDACRLSKAEVAVVPHRDAAAAEAVLRGRSWRRAAIVTDAVFSADGDAAPLRDLHAVARAAGALLVVDDAHGLGVVGPGGVGSLAATGLAGQPDVVATATLSKALGSQGGVVFGPPAVRAHLIDAARTFIFDTGLAPACAGAALAALRVLREQPGLAEATRTHARALATLTGAHEPAGAVVSVVIGPARAAFAAAQTCLELGVRVGCFRPPTVPPGTSRLRLAARADLSAADLRRAAAALRAAGVTTGA